MGAKAFTVVRGDDYKQPFTITLDQARQLDGAETWKLTIRDGKGSSTALLVLTSPTGIEVDGTTFEPTAVFRPNDFSTFTVGEDADYDYDLEMTKTGKIETLAIDTITVRGDVSR